MRATAAILAKVEDQKFHKAVEGIRSGVYHTIITLRTKEEVRGFVRKGDGKEYGCTITETGAFCSCPDALYRGRICKHAVALALDVSRNPEAQDACAEPLSYNLKLVRTRPDFPGFVKACVTRSEKGSAS